MNGASIYSGILKTVLAAFFIKLSALSNICINLHGC